MVRRLKVRKSVHLFHVFVKPHGLVNLPVENTEASSEALAEVSKEFLYSLGHCLFLYEIFNVDL